MSVRKLLPKTCVVLEATPATLLIKCPVSKTSPSLFEEAIALSKLRGLLTAKSGIPKEVPQNTRLQAGIVTIPFANSVSPDVAADAMAAALSVDGVQKVRATFDIN